MKPVVMHVDIGDGHRYVAITIAARPDRTQKFADDDATFRIARLDDVQEASDDDLDDFTIVATMLATIPLRAAAASRFGTSLRCQSSFGIIRSSPSRCGLALAPRLDFNGHARRHFSFDSNPPPKTPEPKPAPPPGLLGRILPPSLVPPQDSSANLRKIFALAKPERRAITAAVGLVRFLPLIIAFTGTQPPPSSYLSRRLSPCPFLSRSANSLIISPRPILQVSFLFLNTIPVQHYLHFYFIFKT